MRKVNLFFKKFIQSKPIMMALFLVCSIVGIGFGSGNVQAAVPEAFTMKPGETGNVYYDTSNVYMMYGTRNGQAWSDATAPMAVKPDDGGIDIMTFCVQPGVPFISSDNPGYQAVSANDIPHEAQVASAIWNNPILGICGDANENDRIVTQSVIWELLPYGIHVDDIPRISNYAQRKALLYQKIADYDKVPEFNKQTIELTYGQSKTLTSSVNLNSFETQVSNSANINWAIAPDGKSVTVTPTDPNVQSGTISYKRSYMEGTPIALEKQGSQRVVVPAIKDPRKYLVNFKINTFGEFQIKKIDKETGQVVPGTRFQLEYSNIPAGTTVPIEVTTSENGLSSKIKVPHGAHVKATETFVPAPYVLGSVIGDSDVIEGDIVAGQTITLTQRNKKAKGQIIVEKSGVESGKDMWNNNYSLAGNVFEVRKDSPTGEVIRTITTEETGHAETAKDLELGTYWVTEKTASNGFANTFKPVEVKIEYENQTTAVIIKNTEGTNQEVTGSTVLTKEDTETGSETQGRATFDGAQYGLFYEDGTPVKWTDNFKPTTSKGNKLEGDEVKFELSDEEQQASVEHLALGKYFWKELVAPKGYQLDNTKREFEVTYKDQDTQVIATESISKENVIKFTLDGFKYVKSQSGSTQSGYNGIELKLTPIEPTKGEARTVKTETDANGYDGYWKFEGVPYGDYDLEEVKAPEGYELITPLTIRSSFDEEKREYTFTITEKGSKEPLKIVRKTEQEINEGSNIIHLSKLFLVDEHARVPEKPEISSLFVTTEGEKTFNPTVDQKLIDKVENKFDKLDVGKVFYYEAQLHKLDKDGKDTLVDTIELEQKVEKENFDFDVKFDYKANTLKHGEKLVVTYVVYSDKEHTDEYARHFDLSNEKQTLEAVTPGMPTIETLFLTKDGSKTFDPTKDQTLIDEVKATVPKEDIGKTFYYVTQFHKIDKDGNVTVVGTDESEHQAGEKTYEFKSVYNYKANTLKDGEKLVATHIAYTDKEHKNEYAKHFDLKNEKQTLTAKTPAKAVTPNTPSTPKTVLPQTSGALNGTKVFCVFAVVMVIAVGTVVYMKKQRANK
ncbi:collagen binding domain-containing protein [Enterococcus sp. C76]|uniref:collagen binding domain-containing protein n=1 Tax=Enterococcus sp. C76 TaxID=3231334 RepID=UPI00349FEFE9